MHEQTHKSECRAWPPAELGDPGATSPGASLPEGSCSSEGARLCCVLTKNMEDTAGANQVEGQDRRQKFSECMYFCKFNLGIAKRLNNYQIWLARGWGKGAGSGGLQPWVPSWGRRAVCLDSGNGPTRA